MGNSNHALYHNSISSIEQIVSKYSILQPLQINHHNTNNNNNQFPSSTLHNTNSFNSSTTINPITIPQFIIIHQSIFNPSIWKQCPNKNDRHSDESINIQLQPKPQENKPKPNRHQQIVQNTLTGEYAKKCTLYFDNLVDFEQHLRIFKWKCLSSTANTIINSSSSSSNTPYLKNNNDNYSTNYKVVRGLFAVYSECNDDNDDDDVGFEQRLMSYSHNRSPTSALSNPPSPPYAIVKLQTYYQHIFISLSNIQDLPYPDNIYLLLLCLREFSILYQIFGPFEIKEEMIFIDTNGEVKVWVDEGGHKRNNQNEKEMTQTQKTQKNPNNKNSRPKQNEDQQQQNDKSREQSQMVWELLKLIHNCTDHSEEVYSFYQEIKGQQEQQSEKESLLSHEQNDSNYGYGHIPSTAKSPDTTNNPPFVLSFQKCIHLLLEFISQKQIQSIPENLLQIVEIVNAVQYQYNGDDEQSLLFDQQQQEQYQRPQSELLQSQPQSSFSIGQQKYPQPPPPLLSSSRPQSLHSQFQENQFSSNNPKNKHQLSVQLTESPNNNKYPNIKNVKHNNSSKFSLKNSPQSVISASASSHYQHNKPHNHNSNNNQEITPFFHMNSKNQHRQQQHQHNARKPHHHHNQRHQQQPMMMKSSPSYYNNPQPYHQTNPQIQQLNISGINSESSQQLFLSNNGSSNNPLGPPQQQQRHKILKDTNKPSSHFTHPHPNAHPHLHQSLNPHSQSINHSESHSHPHVHFQSNPHDSTSSPMIALNHSQNDKVNPNLINNNNHSHINQHDQKLSQHNNNKPKKSLHLKRNDKNMSLHRSENIFSAQKHPPKQQTTNNNNNQYLLNINNLPYHHHQQYQNHHHHHHNNTIRQQNQQESNMNTTSYKNSKFTVTMAGGGAISGSGGGRPSNNTIRLNRSSEINGTTNLMNGYGFTDVDGVGDRNGKKMLLGSQEVKRKRRSDELENANANENNSRQVDYYKGGGSNPNIDDRRYRQQQEKQKWGNNKEEQINGHLLRVPNRKYSEDVESIHEKLQKYQGSQQPFNQVREQEQIHQKNETSSIRATAQKDTIYRKSSLTFHNLENEIEVDQEIAKDMLQIVEGPSCS